MTGETKMREGASGILESLAAAGSLAAAALPSCQLALVIASAAYVRLGLGRWPVAYKDVISSRTWSFIEALLMAGVVGVSFAPVAWIVFTSVQQNDVLARRRRWEAALLIVGGAALLGLPFVDRTGFVEWFMD